MGLSDLAYGIYERRLKGQIPADRIPRHVGVILDGNRRWALAQGSSSSAGHRAGDRTHPGGESIGARESLAGVDPTAYALRSDLDALRQELRPAPETHHAE